MVSAATATPAATSAIARNIIPPPPAPPAAQLPPASTDPLPGVPRPVISAIGEHQPRMPSVMATAHAPPINAHTQGILMSWRAEKGFGFIRPDDGGDSFFAHFHELTNAERDAVTEGARVAFEICIDTRTLKKRAKMWSLLGHDGGMPHVAGALMRALPPPPAPAATASTSVVEVAEKYINSIVGANRAGLEEIRNKAGGQVQFEISAPQGDGVRKVHVAGADAFAVDLAAILVMDRLLELV
eukprot:NODE_14372_length_1113_cov_4.269777.p1 GENE.NODE_14372_length_1113_cov_4.269777~~NODE_14372_length_1113_cov_4.269777.p1  ORF type:complete len:282 (-),score=100.38 NODE_14372_length_1113_cov_4.269777:266-991(-)